MAQDQDRDPQDQAEVFDETHLDDEGDGDVMPDEADPSLDLTQAVGDADPAPFDEDDKDLDEALALDGVEDAADDRPLDDRRRVSEIDAESRDERSEDEVELVYAGLMRNQRGAQASAAHWEARRLDDDDIEALGYGPDAADEIPSETDPAKETRT